MGRGLSGSAIGFIEPIAEDSATGSVAELYEQDRAGRGSLAKMTRAFSHRPAVNDAWRALRAALTSTMDPRRYELVTLAVARRLLSSYCMLAHAEVLANDFYDAETVRRIATDHGSAGLDPVDVAVMDLAEKVAADATSVTQEDVDRLRDLGLADAETLDALGFQPDAEYAELDPRLREALVVGRPIEAD